jgi:hypothetical protein
VTNLGSSYFAKERIPQEIGASVVRIIMDE